MGGRVLLLRIWVLGFLSTFFLLGGTLAANGVQENRVAKAKELIAQKDYNDAILILTAVVREEPDRQDEAQELISEIVRQRNQYNDDYENLIKLLYDQKDEATALKVIARLESLDKNPNKQTVDDINQAKRTARLIANNKRYQDIMTRGAAFLDRGEYASAVQVYLEGSDLAKDMFVEAGYGNVVSNLVDRTWEELRASSTLFIQAGPKLKALPAQGASFLATETASSAGLDAAVASLRDLAVWRQKAWNDGRLFRSQNDFLTKNGRQEDFFLGYSYLFVHGRPDAKLPEGILGAIDRMWKDVFDPWSIQIRNGVEARYTQAKAVFDQGQFSDAASAFEALRVRARQGLDVVTLWNRLTAIDETGALAADVKPQLGPVIPLAVWLDHRLTLANQGLQASRGLLRTAALLPRTEVPRATLEAARLEARGQKDVFTQYANTVSLWSPQSRRGTPLSTEPSFRRLGRRPGTATGRRPSTRKSRPSIAGVASTTVCWTEGFPTFRRP